MPNIFDKETVGIAGKVQDTGKLAEINNHELLRAEDTSDQIASFDQIRSVGKWFLEQKYNAVLPSSKPLPTTLIDRSQLRNGGSFLGKLALGADITSQFPVTIEVVTTPQGQDLRVHIVPIDFGALEIAQFGQRSDSLLALAAAAAVAPQFILALENGIKTTMCSSKKETVSAITPDHGTPLAVTFDVFGLSTKTLTNTIEITGNNDISIKQAAHLHGQNKPSTEKVSQAASASKIAAGVPITTLLRSQLPKHALFITTQDDPVSGEKRIVSMNESLWSAGVSTAELSFLAAALGFTAQVVGDSNREKTIEKILTPTHADTPLRELVQK